MLGDGHIRYDPINAPQIKGRLEFTFSAKILHYVKYLKQDVLAFICNKSEPIAWPNPNVTGKEPTQYWFSKRLSSISDLHSVWYKQIEGKYVKILPLNIEQLLTPLGLAHWIMGDGYFTDGCVKICTDNFTEQDVLNLVKVLFEKFAIKATANKRNNPDGKVLWTIRISKSSMEQLKLLVGPDLMAEMLYKLGVKK